MPSAVVQSVRPILLTGVDRVLFNMALSATYLTAAVVVTSIAAEHTDLEVLVNISQMTVSQMTSTNSTESLHQRLHWLGEQIPCRETS